MDERGAVARYHERTKHHFHRYAEGPGRLDWANQPNPFRIYEGAPKRPLALDGGEGPATFDALHRTGAVSCRPLNAANLGRLLRFSMGLSAWKALGEDRWALRCNPSSGNLHPTEAYVASPGLTGLAAGVYHYDSLHHALELRSAPSSTGWSAAFPEGTVLLGLASIHWREAWKYGERAFRYCQHDAGHALAAVRYAAAALGWRATLLEGWSDEAGERLLGLRRDEDFEGADREAFDLLLSVGPSPAPVHAAAFLEALDGAVWSGRANGLSAERVPWPAIEQVHEASRLGGASGRVAEETTDRGLPALQPPPTETGAMDLFLRRRSAVAFDGRGTMPRASFFRILDALLPRPGVPPFDALTWAPRIHLALFAHRVEGLAAGLYVFARASSAVGRLRSSMNPAWAWDPVPEAPAHLPLFRLASEDLREPARVLSCVQAIASDSCFSLGMLAEFATSLDEGAWWYRRLYWEAGAVGQALYLRAEAEGFRGTGIGCYFDDEVHRFLGIEGDALQSLYHFTVGVPIEDGRLTTLEPYGHLEGREQASRCAGKSGESLGGAVPPDLLTS